MKIYIADTEVLAQDWVVVAKDIETGQYRVIANEAEAVLELFSENAVFGFFNGKHYDQFIIKAICFGLDHADIKAVNDWIIAGNSGYDCPLLNDAKLSFFNQFDLMDDMQAGLSLKSIEGHLGLPIVESSVPFDIDTKLTDEQLEEVIRYCKYDVDSAERVYQLRKPYLETKIDLGTRIGIEPEQSLFMTNAKLTARVLGASRIEHDDERKYTYPSVVQRAIDDGIIPQEVVAFFDTLHDGNLTDDEVFSQKLEITLGGCPCVIGFGGIHGALECYEEKSDDIRGIFNDDVESLYPSLMVIFNYTSRNIPSPQVFKDVYDERIAAKHTGDKKTSNSLKLVLNTTYGASLNRYNDLYDPLMGRSVCITGQLLMVILAVWCAAIPTLRILQLNTDGIAVSLDRQYQAQFDKVKKDWQELTGFSLEEDNIAHIVQKDVNNYVMVTADGHEKIKGGYLVRGIAPAGAFNINNNAPIVARAIKENLIHGTSPLSVIYGETDPLAFQMIAKASSKYSDVFQLVGDSEIPCQRCNRVYASRDKKLGTLYKVKRETGAVVKIESIPEHLFIDNENSITVADIDRDWYVALAKKRISDFRKGERMATTKPKAEEQPANVYQKLLTARNMFLACNIKKSGVNQHLEFKYFELEDIVPAAEKIFAEVGLLLVTSFDKEVGCCAVVHNTDKPEETIEFGIPWEQVEPIVSNTGRVVTNAVQTLGMSITYLRRYMYQIVLDIVENDEIDAGESVEPVKKSAQKMPVTAEKRNEIAAKLTQSSDSASETQVSAVLKALKKLKELDTGKKHGETVKDYATRAKAGLTKKQAEDMLIEVSALIAEIEGE